MPRGDGTGPPGGGGGGSGMGRGGGQAGGGGRMGGKSLGPSGKCVCPNCGNTVSHKRGVPCTQRNCPKCGSAMTRG